jgi:BASS family bile acid:Na+ symporter
VSLTRQGSIKPTKTKIQIREILTMEILGHFVTATMFTLMLTIGVNDTFQQLISVWRRSAVLARSLFAAIVAVPVLVMLLLWVLDLSPAVATALALLAASPGAPLTTTRSKIAAADTIYVSSLQLSLALLAVVVTPIWLAIFFYLFDLTIESVTPIKVASQVAQVTFLPVVIGLLLQRVAPKFIDRVRKPLNILAVAMFVLLVLAVVVVLVMTAELREMLILDLTSVSAILIMAISALTIGHFLGGRRPEERGGLATICVARNWGLAVYISTLSEAGAESIPAMTVYLILGATMGVVYGLWIRRQVDNKLEA